MNTNGLFTAPVTNKHTQRHATTDDWALAGVLQVLGGKGRGTAILCSCHVSFHTPFNPRPPYCKTLLTCDSRTFRVRNARLCDPSVTLWLHCGHWPHGYGLFIPAGVFTQFSKGKQTSNAASLNYGRLWRDVMYVEDEYYRFGEACCFCLPTLVLMSWEPYVTHQIKVSLGSKNDDCNLLNYDTVQYRTWLPLFRSNLLTPFSGQ